MMDYILTAALVMVGITLAQHLGLTEAIAKVVMKIARCNMCCTFWSCLGMLMVGHCDPVVAALLSIIMAYASHWLVLVLFYLQTLFDKIWQRIQQRSLPK